MNIENVCMLRTYRLAGFDPTVRSFAGVCGNAQQHRQLGSESDGIEGQINVAHKMARVAYEVIRRK
jgi:hypothetical protein